MSEETAIQEQDVVEESAIQEDVEQKKPILARDSITSELAARRREELAKHVEPAEEPDEEPELVDLKVNGEVIQKPRDEVDAEGGVAAMQKKLSAEARLAQAAEDRKKLAREQEEFNQRQADFRRREVELQRREVAFGVQSSEMEKLAKDKSNDVTEDDVAIARQFVESVYSGEEDEALAAFQKVMTALKGKEQRPQEKVDPNEIADKVERQVEYKTSRKEGIKILQEQYAHIVDDPALYRMTDQATARLKQDHPEWEPKRIIVEAAKEVDTLVKSWAGRLQPEPADTLAERLERKKKIDKVPTAQTRKPGAQAPKAKTKEEIFEQLRRGRSQ